jgi:hypothetical protein
MGIRMIDTSDKTAPREVAFILATANMDVSCKMDCELVGRQTWGSYFGSDGLIYASDIELGLFIVDPAGRGNSGPGVQGAASFAAARGIRTEASALELRVTRGTRGGYEISFAAGEGVGARAAVYDVAGRKVADLGAGIGGASFGGRRAFRWDGRDASGTPVARGIYFVRAEAGGRVAGAKLAHLGE